MPKSVSISFAFDHLDRNEKCISSLFIMKLVLKGTVFEIFKLFKKIYALWHTCKKINPSITQETKKKTKLYFNEIQNLYA